MCECASVASSYITNVKTAHFVYNPAAETRNSFALCDLWIMKMDLTNLNKRLWAIEYPGLVQNKDNMIKTLGGIANISKVNSNWCSETKKNGIYSPMTFVPDIFDRQTAHGSTLSSREYLQQAGVRWCSPNDRHFGESEGTPSQGNSAQYIISHQYH